MIVNYGTISGYGLLFTETIKEVSFTCDLYDNLPIITTLDSGAGQQHFLRQLCVYSLVFYFLILYLYLYTTGCKCKKRIRMR